MKNTLKISELLSHYGIGRQTLWRWRKHKDFPNPISPKYALPIWDVKDIEQWERSNAA